MRASDSRPRPSLVLPCAAPVTERDFARLATRLRSASHRASSVEHADGGGRDDLRGDDDAASPPATPRQREAPPPRLRGCHVASVPGLRLVYDVVTPEEEAAALAALEEDGGVAASNIHVATQWGWRFSTWNRMPPLRDADRLAPLPQWQRALVAALLRADPARDFLPTHAEWGHGVEHALLNCYQPGDGVAPHTDDQQFWTGWVLGLSLGSDVTMLFHPPRNANACCGCLPSAAAGADAGVAAGGGDAAAAAPVAVRLPARSLYVLTGDARWTYRHEIVRTGADWVAGQAVARHYRASVTWRGISEKWLPRELADAHPDFHAA